MWKNKVKIIMALSAIVAHLPLLLSKNFLAFMIVILV
jgi:hypothetical protein